MNVAHKQRALPYTLNVAYTKYPLLRHVAQKKFAWALSTSQHYENWDLLWTDGAVSTDRLARMKPYQKINHFPGMDAVSRKNLLALNLNRMRRAFPERYKFFPATWLVPAELGSLLEYSRRGGKKWFIVKPEAKCQGRGIFLTSKVETLNEGPRCVVQQYVDSPLLIDGLKFDLRIYVLITGCAPLRVFVHREGLARFATENYTQPTVKNLRKGYMHLTNYAINKRNSKFVFNSQAEDDATGHKRSLAAVLGLLQARGVDIQKLWRRIVLIIVKTLCSVQPAVAHNYRACQPDDPYNGSCFEVLGFDILIDKQEKPLLLEVNSSPSFTADSPLDRKVKSSVLTDTFKLLNCTVKARENYELHCKQTANKRVFMKKYEIDRQQKEREFDAAQLQRDEWEDAHLGGFQKIYPCTDRFRFDLYIQAANEMWREKTGVRPRTGVPRNQVNEQPPLRVPSSSCIERLSRPVQRTVSSIVYNSVVRPVFTGKVSVVTPMPFNANQLFLSE